MRKLTEERLLREYVRRSLRVLNEDDAGYAYGYGGYYDEGAAVYAAGYSGANPSELMSTFITPFTDVFKTAVASTKMITTDAVTLLNVAFSAVIATIIPFITVRYDKIFDERDKKIDKIKSDYKDVFDRTDEALAGSDAKLLAFLVSPDLFLGGAAALKAPAATRGLLDVATGGVFSSMIDKFGAKWKQFHDKQLAGEGYDKKQAQKDKQNLNDDLVASIRASLGKNEALFHGIKNVLREEEEKPSSAKTDSKTQIKSEKKPFDDRAFLKDILSDDRVVKALSDAVKANPRMKELQTKLATVEDETLKKSEEMASSIIGKIKTFDDIKKIAAQDSKSAQAVKKIEQIKDPKEKQKAVDLLSDNISGASKQAFLATMNARMKLFPKDSAEYKKYEKSFNKLKTL